LFEAEMWPQRRPTPRELTVSLTKPLDSAGFQRGIPQRIIQVDRPGVGRPGYPIRLRDAVPPSEEEKLWRPGVPKAASDAPAASDAQPEASPVSPESAPELSASDGEGLEDTGELDSGTPEMADPMDDDASDPEPAGRHIFDDESIREIREQALAEGREQGLAEGDAQGYARGLEEGRQTPSEDAIEALKEGFRAECMEEARKTLEAEIRAELEGPIREANERIQKLVTELTRAARHTEAFHAPLQRLALHLAEQLVRSELSTSPTAVSRLIDRCLSEFGQTALAPVTIALNGDDRALLKEAGLDLPAQAELRQDDTLSRGSVRVAINGAVIEDLMETRYKALWRALTQDESAEPPPSFLKNVELVKEAFSDEVIDAE